MSYMIFRQGMVETCNNAAAIWGRLVLASTCVLKLGVDQPDSCLKAQYPSFAGKQWDPKADPKTVQSYEMGWSICLSYLISVWFVFYSSIILWMICLFCSCYTCLWVYDHIILSSVLILSCPSSILPILICHIITISPSEGFLNKMICQYITF